MLVVTAADSGDLFRVHQGSRVEVRLVGKWTAPHAIGTSVVRVRAARTNRYVTALFTAEASGSAELLSTETPLRRFFVHVVVLPSATRVEHALVDATADENAILDLLRAKRPAWSSIGQRAAYARLHLLEANRAGPSRKTEVALADVLRTAVAARKHDARAARAATLAALALTRR